MLDELSDRMLVALRECAQGGDLSILVDPTLLEPAELDADWLPTLKQAQQQQHAKVQRLGAIHANFDRERLPYLVHLPSEPTAERLLAISVHIACREAMGEFGPQHRARVMCGWFVGEPDSAKLASRLTHLAQVVRPDGAYWYLRFWDPRVCWHLSRVLTQDQWQAVASALGSWWTISPLNELTGIGDQDRRSPPPAAQPGTLPLPLRFDEKSWAPLARVGTVNTALAMATDWGFLPTPASARLIDQLMQRCQAWGFTTEQDQLVFTACALSSHRQFDDHPQVHKALREAARDERSVQSAVADFDDTFWSDLTSTAWQPVAKEPIP